jgi:hypothetical protein
MSRTAAVVPGSRFSRDRAEEIGKNRYTVYSSRGIQFGSAGCRVLVCALRAMLLGISEG